MQMSDEDWQGSTVGFRLAGRNNFMELQFYHTGWERRNEHYRISNFSWTSLSETIRHISRFYLTNPIGLVFCLS
jgi:hypothetical protein